MTFYYSGASGSIHVDLGASSAAEIVLPHPTTFLSTTVSPHLPMDYHFLTQCTNKLAIYCKYYFTSILTHVRTRPHTHTQTHTFIPGVHTQHIIIFPCGPQTQFHTLNMRAIQDVTSS